jgi:PKD repeat protein
MRGRIILFVAGLIVGGAVLPGLVGPVVGDLDRGNATVESDVVAGLGDVSTVNRTGDSRTMWASSTTFAGGMRTDDLFDVSTADDNGSMHVVYTRDEELHYARLTTRGQVEIERQLLTADREITEVNVVAEPDGHAHILYYANSTRGTNLVRRVVIAPNGTTAFDHTVVSKPVSGPVLGLENTTALGRYGRVYTVVDVGPGTFELVSIDVDSPTVSTRAIAGDAVSVHIAVQDETLYATYGSRQIFSEIEYLNVKTFDLRPDGIEFDQRSKISDRDYRFGVKVDSVAVSETGLLVIPHTLNLNRDSRRSGEAIVFDPNQGTVVANLSSGGREVAFDQDGRLYLMRADDHIGYDAGFVEAYRTSMYTGQVAINRDGYPSIVSQTTGGQLVYRPMVVRGTERIPDLYARYESVNEALVAENARLRNATGAVLNVTVTPGNAEGDTFTVGGTAEVAVAATNASPQDVTIDYQNVTYMPDADGRVSVPLNESGRHALTVSYRELTRTVSLNVADSLFDGPLPGAGSDVPPTDPDGDGMYEDIDGDGRFGFLDVVEFLFALNDIGNADLTPTQVAALDFDGTGKIGFLDVVELLFEIG